MDEISRTVHQSYLLLIYGKVKIGTEFEINFELIYLFYSRLQLKGGTWKATITYWPTWWVARNRGFPVPLYSDTVTGAVTFPLVNLGQRRLSQKPGMWEQKEPKHISTGSFVEWKLDTQKHV